MEMKRMSTKKAMETPCKFCAGKVARRVIRARFLYKGETLYVDHVPAWVCRRCGETYYDAPVYKRLEQIAKHREKIKQTVSFPLAEYETVKV